MHTESKKEKKTEKKRPRKPIVTNEDEMKKRNPQSTLDINRAP